MQNILIGIIIGMILMQVIRHYFPVITQEITNRIGKVKARSNGKTDVSQIIDIEKPEEKRKKRKFLGIFPRKNKVKSKN